MQLLTHLDVGQRVQGSPMGKQFKGAAQPVVRDLPKTLLRVSLPSLNTTETPGPFADLAPYFLPATTANDIIQTVKHTYLIDKAAVTVTSRGVKDPDQMYVVRPTGGIFADTKFYFVLKDQYVPSAISTALQQNAWRCGPTQCNRRPAPFCGTSPRQLLLPEIFSFHRLAQVAVLAVVPTPLVEA